MEPELKIDNCATSVDISEDDKTSVDRDEKLDDSAKLSSDLLLPPKPVEPEASDCCGTGCTPCVYDLYEQELKMWREECNRIRYGEKQNVDPKTQLSPDRYTKFELTRIEPVTTDTNLYTFVVPGNQRLPVTVGQHLVLRWQTSSRVVTRQYTPITEPDKEGEMVIVIKLYDCGEMSHYIRTWTVGDLVEWRGPFGNFTYRRNSYSRIVMFAAGTGVAPMLQLIQSVVTDDRDDTKLHLVVAYRDRGAILCRPLVDELTCYWNVSVKYYLSQEPSDTSSTCHSHNITHSRLTEAHVTSELGQVTADTRVLVCGTKSFDKDVINYLRRSGVTEEQYFKF